MKFNFKKYTRKLKKFQNLFLKRKIFFSHSFNSKAYWEKRYLVNGNSGPGSYGNLAQFKASILNDFTERNNIKSVIEFGCGDGNQLSLANYQKYIGIDVSETAIALCKAKFEEDTSKEFYLAKDFLVKELRAELVLSLDVLFHLIEDSVFEMYMNELFESSTKYVIIYSSNYNKNIAAHVKSRKFTDWVDKNKLDSWELKQIIKNKYPFNSDKPNVTSMSDFYIYQKKFT